MPGGKEAFQASFGAFAAKIDGDPSLEDATKLEFWDKVDACGAQCSKGDERCGCCASFEMHGKTVRLTLNERLGTTQKSMWVAISVANQDDRFTPTDVLRMFAQFETLSPAAGVTALHANFSAVRLTTGTRMFAFRNPDTPLDPWGTAPLFETFTRLAIPADDMEERLAIEFIAADAPHEPSSLDANLRNADAFQYGGMTTPDNAQGLPEVVVLPPQGRFLTKVPKVFS